MSSASEKRKRRLEEGLEKIQKRAQEEAAQPVPFDPAEKDADAHYPCPADGSTLYGGMASKRWDGSDPLLLDHCEDCHMLVTRAKRPPDVTAELAALERDGDELVVPNRRSWAAWLGAAGWADMGAAEHRLHLTPEAARLLLAKQGIEVLKVRTPFSFRGYRGMLQTMINAFTLRNNFARHVIAGNPGAAEHDRPARDRARRRRHRADRDPAFGRRPARRGPGLPVPARRLHADPDGADSGRCRDASRRQTS